MHKSESTAALFSALSKAQLEVENATKNASNPHFKSRYADLSEVLNTVRPVFSKHGLSIVQLPGYEAGIASMETILAHDSGEWMSGISKCKLTKDDAQGYGSACTYLRRYSLAALAAIAQEDDDGNVASQPKVQAKAGETRLKEAATPAIAPKVVDLGAQNELAQTWLQRISQVSAVADLANARKLAAENFPDPDIRSQIESKIDERIASLETK